MRHSALCFLATIALYTVNNHAAENTLPATTRQKPPAVPATAAEIQRKQAQMKADFERKQAHVKRKSAQDSNSLRPGQQQLREQAARYLQPHERTPTSPFNAAAAPAPDE